jgi:hypothetical protein
MRTTTFVLCTLLLSAMCSEKFIGRANKARTVLAEVKIRLLYIYYFLA